MMSINTHTFIAPDLIVVKVRVTRHFIPAGEEGVGQGATLPVKRVAVFVKQAVKRHSDVTLGRRSPSVAGQSAEIQRGCIAPSIEGVSQDGVHQTRIQAGRDGLRRVAVDTWDKNRIYYDSCKLSHSSTIFFVCFFLNY